MSAEVVPIDNTIEAALAYAEAGYLVFPIKWGTKEPATTHGFHDASTDPAQIEAWWRRGRFNLGLATGPQPNGWNLLAVDVDTDKGGKISFLDLVDRHEARELLSAAPQHMTPRGGWHLFFDAPEDYRNTRERMGMGIDTRGAGGYVVLPPSRWANEDGELKPYVAKPGLGLLERQPLALPGWMLEELTPKPVVVERWHPSSGPSFRHDETSAYDWVRDNEDWPNVLTRHGWMPHRRQPNGDQLWRRPNKMDRGHSAVLHPSGAFVVFTTEVPRQLEGLGQPTRDGTGFSVSLGDFICAYEHNGDRSAFARAIRQRMPRVEPPRPLGEPDTTVPSPVTTQGDAQRSSLNLPPEFWESRPIFAHIHQLAWSHMVSPDALLANVLVRWATMVPPCYLLPDIVGTYGTFDLIGCIVAETAGGKSIAAGVARDYVRSEDQALRFDVPVGSGEGLLQAYMVDELDDNGKRTGKQRVGMRGIHFIADEAVGMMAQAGRRGSTLLTTLTSAWTGGTLGQANAAQENRRIIEARTVRVGAVMNIQSSNGYLLFEEEVQRIGLTGRLLFASATDPSMPRRPPERPGPLRFPRLPIIGGGVVLGYPSAVIEAILDERHARATGNSEASLATSHALLMRCKIAGLLTLQDDRRSVSDDDWEAAGLIVEASSRLLTALQQLRQGQVEAQAKARAATRGELEYVAEDAKERRLVAALGDRICTRVMEADPDKPWALGKLKNALTSSATRHRWDGAVEWAVNSGRVRVDGDHLRPA